jgi:hypothetical protein
VGLWFTWIELDFSGERGFIYSLVGGDAVVRNRLPLSFGRRRLLDSEAGFPDLADGSIAYLCLGLGSSDMKYDGRKDS